MVYIDMILKSIQKSRKIAFIHLHLLPRILRKHFAAIRRDQRPKNLASILL
jgi:hypothetical protein